ncbi:unnamed protein product [Adineta ricciae]|uniref:TIL domain-containing protein n=1 Tax=Adineta ricciae TaxID=249248 RepID=A0A815X7C1_ADIRI|nr:unnamed protein product [Adineta ricciae]CAF1552858.1 unnamed protein product [Adineta ricciae]
MTMIIYASILLLLISTINGQQSVCKANETFRGCGANCVETCDFKPHICMAVCKSGCFCNDGYVRQSSAADSPCVKRETCKQKEDTSVCGANEEYRTCGSACVETCTFKPQICTEQCVAGCFCKNGHVRRDSNKKSSCVKRQEC